MATTMIDARPAAVDLNLYAGDSVTLEIAVKDNAGVDFDLTGYTAEAQIKATAADATGTNLTCTVVSNVITVVLDAADAATLPEKGVWDVQVESAGGAITTVAGGKVTVTPEVTK